MVEQPEKYRQIHTNPRITIASKILFIASPFKKIDITHLSNRKGSDFNKKWTGPSQAENPFVWKEEEYD